MSPKRFLVLLLYKAIDGHKPPCTGFLSLQIFESPAHTKFNSNFVATSPKHSTNYHRNMTLFCTHIS